MYITDVAVLPRWLYYRGDYNTTVLPMWLYDRGVRITEVTRASTELVSGTR